MFPPVFSLLTTGSAGAAVKAIVGTSPPQIWEDVQPQDHATKRPYIVWSVIGGVPENYLDQVPTMDSGRVRIGIWSTSVTERRNLMAAVRAAIEPSAHMVGIPVGTYEPETKLYGYWMDFQFWVSR